MFNIFSSDFPEHLKTNESLKLLGFNENIDDNTKKYLLNEIAIYLFETTKNVKIKDKVFDFEQDFKYYYSDFLKFGINLCKEDISWFEFNMILEDVFLDDKSYISRVIQFRTYEKPPKKGFEEKEHKFYMEKKRQYALKNENKTDEYLEKMWNYAHKKSKKGDD